MKEASDLHIGWLDIVFNNPDDIDSTGRHIILADDGSEYGVTACNIDLSDRDSWEEADWKMGSCNECSDWAKEVVYRLIREE